MRYLATRRALLVIALLAASVAKAQSQPPQNSTNSPPSGGSQADASNAPLEQTLSAMDAGVGGGLSGKREQIGKIIPPKPISTPDPECSHRAVRDRWDGTTVLWLVIGIDGKPRNMKVARPLGHGLDERAIEAVSGWTFKPGTKEGRPVQTEVNVEVTFHECINGAASQKDDAVIYLRLAAHYFSGEGLAKDPKKGYEYLLLAASLGLPQAQFDMGEYTVLIGDAPGDHIVAYMWYDIARRNGFKKKESDGKLKELAAKMSPENIAEAETKALNWKPSKD